MRRGRRGLGGGPGIGQNRADRIGVACLQALKVGRLPPSKCRGAVWHVAQRVGPSRTQGGRSRLLQVRTIARDAARTALAFTPAVRSAGCMRIRAAVHVDGPSPPVEHGRSHRAALLNLQAAAGNAAVSALLTGRAGDPPTGREPRPARDTQVQRTPLPVALAEALGRPPGPTAVQRTLADDLRRRVDIYGPPDYSGLMALIRAASAAERQAALADTALMHSIGNRFNRTWATTLASALLEGTHTWANPPANDFFAFFVQGSGSGPANPASTMNCWESIMYAAYLTGAVSAAWIRTYYLTAMKQPDPNAAAYALLGWTPALPTYDPSAGREPRTGQLIFYQTGSSAVPGHVAIYMGSGQIMSLWTQPRGVDHIQQVGIGEIAGTIYFRDPPW
jgi:hypothetical protein